MKNFILLPLYLLVFFSTLTGQTKLDYDNDTRWFWGLNGGVTWHSTDVRTKTNWGFGMVLGKSFNYNYGKAISFDFRSRFLYGEWYGQNNKKTDTSIYSNKALSSGNANYKDSLGYYVLNFRTKLYSLDLELVLHANSLRERTGWDLYAFGGVGVSAFKATGDLLDKNGKLYDYGSLPDLKDGSLSSLHDKKYETYLDGSGKSVSYLFMPSVGIGLGYQVSRNFSMGLEHRTTFSLVDHFDGYNNPKESNNKLLKRQNDIFHYTSAYLRFQLHRNTASHADNTTTTTVSTDTPVQRIPEINFTNPATSGNTVTSSAFALKASIKYISNRENVNFKQNGVYMEGFSYNNVTEKFESNVVLYPGQNVFEIIATNPYGSDQKNTIIIYKEAQQAAPVVNFTNPGTNPYPISTSYMQVSARVLNVKDQSQLMVNFNGMSVSNYTFSPSDGSLSLPVNLTVGTNIVTITATNQVGSDTKTATIVYNPVIQESLPLVYFTDPNKNPFSTLSPSVTIAADVLNVLGKENITFKQNGVFNQNFSYNSFNHRFESSVFLVPGQNVFEIIASNTSGVAQATTIIVFEKQAPRPPVVTITNPVFSPYQAGNEFFPLAASVLNVDFSNQVQVLLNGVVVPNINFSALTHTINTTLLLAEGQNTVQVSASNNDGSDSKQVILIYKKPVLLAPPVVTFIWPTANPMNVSTASQNISALVLNVENSSGITIHVNGSVLNSFTFNPTTKTVSFQKTLVEGANLITITASNGAGTDTKSSTLIYNKIEAILPPSVIFLDPNTNPATVYNQQYTIQAKVSGVSSKQNILVTINGIATNNFTYNPSTELVSFNSSLIVGANIFEITATNAGGSDKKTSTIIYKVSEPLLPPVVSITNPLASPYTTSNSSTTVEANVLNISGGQAISVLVNGQSFTNFNYNNTSKHLTLLMPLNEGNNTVKIQATNAAGTHSDSRTIVYKKEVKLNPPLVTFIQPNQPNQTVMTVSYLVKASVLHIENASQLTVSQNGQVLNPMSYTYHPNTKEVKLQTNLTPGNNVFTITASNVSGNHSATTSIIYKKDEQACDKPVISFIHPVQSNMEVSQQKMTIKFKTTYVNSQNQIEILVNGSPAQGVFNMSSKVTDLSVNLNEGQNIIEVSAKNKCGESKANTIIIYKPANVPCANVPSLQLIQPLHQEISTVKQSEEVRIGVLNVTNTADIIFKVNNSSKPFTFEASNKILIATVNLKEGLNLVEVQASNECGSANYTVKITKRACNKPQINIQNNSAASDGTTSSENFSLQASVSGVESSSDIRISNNNVPINFTYNPTLKTLSLNTLLGVGTNTFVIKATNACGEDTKTLTVKRKKVVPVTPPQIQITNPATTPFNSTNAAFNIQATTQNITSASQVSLTVNGQPVNANFNPQNGSLTYNLSLVNGNNVITASASNEFGTASDTKTIIYSKPKAVEKPKIILSNPSTCPAQVFAGINQIKGSIKNVKAANQVSIKLNETVITNFNPVVIDNKLNFQFEINVSLPSPAMNIQIQAINEGGTDYLSCLLKVADAPDSDCMPTVSAQFSEDDKSVSVSSSKALSNVVLKYHDGTVQKFDNLTGMSRTFTASGLSAGKCIVGVWIKSGCNQSNDGPGYGEYVKNPKTKVSCLNTNPGGGNCMPVVSAVFSADSKTVTATSTKELSNVVLKYFDGSVQKFNNLIGKSKSFSGTGTNAGKCIVGIWIKSGCNQSNDGPGYGEFVANNSISSACSTSSSGDCMPTVSALFSADSKSVSVSSTKELINVVLKYYDGQEQKFNGLSGYTKTLSGTGVNSGKCIVGVWIKSGCNQSNDGPNYGEWEANPQNTTNCTTDSKGNNGHGNNTDGIDSSNPGQGGGGPNGGTDGTGDDEEGKGGGGKGGNKSKPTTNPPKSGTNNPPKPGGIKAPVNTGGTRRGG